MNARIQSVFRAAILSTIVGGMVVSVGGASGCAAKKPGAPYIDTSMDFAGPAVELTDGDTVTVTVPSGGWTLKLDQTIRDRFGVHAYATLTRPAPDSMNTGALEELVVEIPGAQGLSLAVYIRLVEQGQKKPNAEPYRLAATTSRRP